MLLEMVIIGDFHLPDIGCHTLTHSLLGFITMSDVSQPVKFSSYQLGNTLDLIFSSLDVSEPTGYSSNFDHPCFKLFRIFENHIHSSLKCSKANFPQIMLDCHELGDVFKSTINDF